MKKVFISGPVTGLEYDQVVKKFNAVEQKLLDMGYQVFNPVSFVKPSDDWKTAMKKCLRTLSICDSICMLKGFESSKGAVIEFNIACDLDYEIMFEENLKIAA